MASPIVPRFARDTPRMINMDCLPAPEPRDPRREILRRPLAPPRPLPHAIDHWEQTQRHACLAPRYAAPTPPPASRPRKCATSIRVALQLQTRAAQSTRERACPAAACAGHTHPRPATRIQIFPLKWLQKPCKERSLPREPRVASTQHFDLVQINSQRGSYRLRAQGSA